MALKAVFSRKQLNAEDIHVSVIGTDSHSDIATQSSTVLCKDTHGSPEYITTR